MNGGGFVKRSGGTPLYLRWRGYPRVTRIGATPDFSAEIPQGERASLSIRGDYAVLSVLIICQGRICRRSFTMRASD